MANYLQFETPAGIIDASNKVFMLSTSCIPDTLEVFINGLLLESSLDDGWVSLTPQSFELKTAPRPSDTLRVAYRTP